MTELEVSIGVEFKHIRLLAKAFTHPSAGLNHLTLYVTYPLIHIKFNGNNFALPSLCRGDYQRLEFLGDSILSFMLASHVYRQFPHYREGHLSVR